MFVLSLLLQPASACGGFFCDSVTPVVQKAERIVFAVDEVAGVVETHVQVEYEGPPDQFAWIVPVQAEPELFVSNQVLFDMVGLQLQPVFALQNRDEGHCKAPFQPPNPACLLGCVDLAFSDSAGSAGVDVVGRLNVGPYDTVTLQADSVEALTTWLTANEFAIPSTAAAAIAPYVSEQGYFVALKLSKGNDLGDLTPLGLRYQGDRPAVPIQLTAVAATDDLRLEVTVFGHRRAVPESYLHVQINDAAIDWFSGGSNYQEVITRAADEAGGHAFATDYAGTTDVLFPNFAVVANVSSLRDANGPGAWIDRLQQLGFAGSSDLLTLFQEVAPVRPGFSAVDVYNCPSCYQGAFLPGFDAQVATDRLQERIIEPRRAIERLIGAYPYVTRMTSSLSASEMTIDPVFTFTDAMPDVEQVRLATLVWACNGKYRRRSDRRLELPNGHSIDLPSERWMQKNNTTEAEYLAELGSVNALTIERTGADGSTVIADLTDQVGEQLDGFNGNGTIARGCGCDNGSAVFFPGMFAGLALLLGLRRRS